MNILVNIKADNSENNIYIEYHDIYELKNYIKNIIISLYQKQLLNYENFISRIHSLINNVDSSYKYYVKIKFELENIYYICYNNENIIDLFIYNIKKNEGNCIDDFLNRGLIPNLKSINIYTSNIEDRLNIRKSLSEYHNSMCYEYDFMQICNIRNILEKCLKNCNKQIERISELYTKN